MREATKTVALSSRQLVKVDGWPTLLKNSLEKLFNVLTHLSQGGSVVL